MTKFEEEAIKEAKKCRVVMNAYDGESNPPKAGLNLKLGRATHNFPWLEFAKNWHSDEEFQELLSKYSAINDNYEKEVIRSSKLESQIANLKSQLKQQALPVVPECVAEFIESYKDRRTIYGVFDKISKNQKTYPKLYEWVFEDENSQATFALSFITGKYEVEKTQLFKVVFPNSTSVLQKNGELNSFADTVYKRYLLDNAMTEQEIKSIDERYWQFAVPVEETK